MRLFQYRVEDRREIAGRGIDDLQHLGGRGLLLQRLARLGQEPRILHRNDRLRGEILQQRDLLVGERPHLPARREMMTKQPAVLAQRHRQHGADTADLGYAPEAWSVARWSTQASAMWTNAFAVNQRSRDRMVWPCERPGAAPRPIVRGSRGRDQRKQFAVVRSQGAVVGIAERMRLIENRVEHRREVAGRGIDDLQDLGGRGLLLQCLARLGQKPRVLHRDDRLRGEILQQRDLLVGKRAHLATVDGKDPEDGVVLAQAAP